MANESLQKQFLLDVIQKYKENPCLWKTTHPSYSDKSSRNCAMQELLQLFRTHDPNATIDTVIKKLASIRAAYNKQRRKLEFSPESEEAVQSHVPSLWYYHHMRFLDQENSRDEKNRLVANGRQEILQRERRIERNKHFRHLLLYAFNQGLKPAKAARGICAVYGPGAISPRTARDWFAKFKNGNFDLRDAPRSGRRVEFDEERLNLLLHENPRQTTRGLAEKMNCSHTAIEKHLHAMRKVQKCGAWLTDDEEQN